MRFPPPSVLITWPPANHVNPENRGPTLMIVELTVLPLALITLALRLYVRFIVVKKIWWDDWLMVAAAFFCCGVTVAVILATQLYGWNMHVWDVSYKQLVQGRQISIAGQTIFVFASGLSKLSILVSYLRISVKGTWFHRLTWASIGLVGAAIPAFLLLLWLQCNPASSYWDLTAVARNCIPEAPPLMGQTIVTVITDFIVYILPMPTLWSLKLPIGQRISLITLFGFGGIVVVAGCMRTYWIHYVELETYDVTWEGFYLWIWAAVEVNLGVICGCAPVLKPLFFNSSSTKGSQYGRSLPTFGSSNTRTFGSSNPRSRSRRPIASTIGVEIEEAYIKLDNLEPGARSPSSLTAGGVPVDGWQQWDHDLTKYPGDGSLEPPPQYPGVPEPAVISPNGHRSVVVKETRFSESGSASWMDDSSV